MNLIAQALAQLSQRWLDGFRLKQGLGSNTEADQVAKDVSLSITGDANSEVECLLLHVGCGRETMETIPVEGFRSEAWREIRFDADQRVAPDIVGTMVDMSVVSGEFADAIYSSHNIEHLYSHEVPVALAEFNRVLKPTGFLVITCPDLQSLCRLVVEDKLESTAYISPAGPIAPIDILYGFRPALAAGNHYMAHRCGFTLKTLMEVLVQSGFLAVHGFRRSEDCFDLWVLASKSERTPEEMAELSRRYLLTIQ